MFGTEQRDDLNPRRVDEEVDGAAALGVHAGVIGDQADMFPPKRRKFFGFKNVDAGLHAARAAGVLRGGAYGRAKRATRGK